MSNTELNIRALAVEAEVLRLDAGRERTRRLAPRSTARGSSTAFFYSRVSIPLSDIWR